ncbi:unannotated protein [freshwater metagenome]|uniref:Unannotated protein n=1 Tax=freshwater metagenome TaxID=449393 RepID=A0A6J7GNW0_9ZZZZ
MNEPVLPFWVIVKLLDMATVVLSASKGLKITEPEIMMPIEPRGASVVVSE